VKKATPDVLDLIALALQAEGYEGLWNSVGCACSLAEGLAPCGGVQDDCQAGFVVQYNGTCPGGACDGGCDYHVQNSRVRMEREEQD
jgi:hypothetical protein